MTSETDRPRTIAPSVDDAIEAVRAYARHMGWSKYMVAKKSALGETTLRGFWAWDWSPNADTLRILHSLIPPDFDPATAPPPSSQPKETHGNGKG